MATYTANYGLHQWVVEDNFQRTDFNEDLQKIDGVLGRTEHSAISSAYNIYNLILRDYYNGGYAEPYKGLIFDGFIDNSRISQCSSGLYLDAAGQCLRLNCAGQDDLSLGYGSEKTITIRSGSNLRQSVLATGNGTMTALQLSYLSGTIRLNVYEDDAQVFQTQWSGAGFASLSTNLSWKAGRTYLFELANEGTAGGYINTLNSGGCGLKACFTPQAVTEGTLTAVQATLDQTSAGAIARVRHTGGSCGVSLSGSAMELARQETAYTVMGTPCLRSTFQLWQSVGNQIIPTISLTGQANEQLVLYEYGISFF